MDLSTSITTNISARNTTHLSANKPRLLSDEKPHTIQMPRGGNELDGVHRRCMPNTQNRQGKHLLSTNPTTKQVACWSLRMETDMRNTTTNDGTLRVQRRTTHGTKDDQRGPPKEKGTTCTNPRDEVLQRRVLATQGGKNKKLPLPQKTDTRGKERMGKGREDTPLGGGERKNPARCRSLAKANTRTAGRRDRNRKTIADLKTNVGNQRRTIASSAFMLGRAEHEVRTLHRAMEKYEVLRSDVRRAGRKLLDLGN